MTIEIFKKVIASVGICEVSDTRVVDRKVLEMKCCGQMQMERSESGESVHHTSTTDFLGIASQMVYGE